MKHDTNVSRSRTQLCIIRKSKLFVKMSLNKEKVKVIPMPFAVFHKWLAEGSEQLNISLFFWLPFNAMNHRPSAVSDRLLSG